LIAVVTIDDGLGPSGREVHRYGDANFSIGSLTLGFADERASHESPVSTVIFEATGCAFVE
jgi:hypothetical protein